MKDAITELLRPLLDDLLFLVAAGLVAFVRAMGVQIDSGTSGLKFSFGRAVCVLEPGFHWLVPFAQMAKKIPTRSRTLDLPVQRVVTDSGHVYHVNVNLVYRVVDVRKALIEIDDVEAGMLRILGVDVQRVVRLQSHGALKDAAGLDAALARDFGRRLEPWGVEVERAAFTSITPSTKTLRITQQSPITAGRTHMLHLLRSSQLVEAQALGLLGSRFRAVSHTKLLRESESRRRRGMRIRRALMQSGWMNVQIRQAERRLRARADVSGRVHAERKPAKARA